MKLNAILGKGTGKLGGMVLSVNSGEQIVREYNPKVSNPQTDAQVEQRAKFKLLSQLAAALSTSIALRKMKMQSPRNRFVSENMRFVTFDNNEATIDLTDINITGGASPMEEISVSRAQGNNLTIALASAAASDIQRVVYNIYKTTEFSKLQFVKEVMVSEAGAGRTFSTTIEVPEVNVLVLAYGIKDVTSKASTKFKEYQAAVSENSAVVDVLKSLSVSDYVLTETVGAINEL